MPKNLAESAAEFCKVHRFRSTLVAACFPFVNGLCLFFATISNQAFSHHRCNLFLGLSYKKTNNTFFISARKNDVGVQIEFPLKFTERAGLMHLLLMYQLRKAACYFMYLKFFGSLAGRSGDVMLRETDWDTKGPG